jgi:hypothetical protein
VLEITLSIRRTFLEVYPLISRGVNGHSHRQRYAQSAGDLRHHLQRRFFYVQS